MYVVAITSVFTGLAVSVVALRLYTRIHTVKAPGLDDLLISFALVCAFIDLPTARTYISRIRYGR